MSEIGIVARWIHSLGITEKADSDQPRHRTGKWVAGGIGSKDFNRETARKAIGAAGHAAGVKRGSEILNDHHQGEGKFHPDVHERMKGEITQALEQKASWGPPDTERQAGYVRGLREVHTKLKAHERVMKN